MASVTILISYCDLTNAMQADVNQLTNMQTGCAFSSCGWQIYLGCPCPVNTRIICIRYLVLHPLAM